MNTMMLGLLNLMDIDFAKWGETLMLVGLFLLSLDVVVMFHEFGHFLVAKWKGIRIEVFSVGMGKRLFGFKVGETDFRFSLLPIGGYVKMAGQEDFAALDEEDVDPNSFANKSVGARFAVIAAGVIMNVIFAFGVFTALAMVGVDFLEAPVVGGVAQGYPANTATIEWEDGTTDDGGLKPGDRILAINGKEIESFQQVRFKSLLSMRKTEYRFTIARQGDGGERIGTATLKVRFATGENGMKTKALSFGLYPAVTLTTAENPAIIPGPGVLEPDLTLIAIDGVPVEHEWDLTPIQEDLTGNPVELTLRAEDGTETVVVQTPTLMMTGTLLTDGRVAADDELMPGFKGAELTHWMWNHPGGEPERIELETLVDNVQLDVLGLQPRMRINAVEKGSRAAKAGILPNDIVLSYGGRPLPTFATFIEISKEFAGKPAELIVLRNGVAVNPLTVTPKKKSGRVVVGTNPGVDQDHLAIANVRKGSPAETAMQATPTLLSATNWVITGVAGDPLTPRSTETWSDLINMLTYMKASGATEAIMTPSAAIGKGLAISLEQFEPDAYEYSLFNTQQTFKPLLAEPVKLNPLAAMGWGLSQTGQQVLMTYQQFGSLFTGTISAKELKGPVGIGGIAVTVAKSGPKRFVFFIGFLSIALAVVNFLPIPVVDGGHALFLIIEKIRGKPMSVKAMNVIQFTGLAILMGLILLLTFRDILSLITNAW